MMKKTLSSVSEPERIWKYRGFALIVFAVLVTSAMGVLVSSFAAFAGQTETANGLPEMEALGDDWPEPTGALGSGWIADQLAEGLSNDAASPSITTGPGGTLHAAYESFSVAAGYQIAYTNSTDGGTTWNPIGLAGYNVEDDLNPDIAVSPADGRIFVAFERHVLLQDVDLHIAYSDDGVTWTQVVIDPGVTEYINPSIVVEHNQGATYNVYVAIEEFFGDPDNVNIHLFRSTDQGVSYTEQLYLGSPPDPSVYTDPDLAYQRGPDLIDRLYMVYAYGNDAVDTQNIGLLWSEDRAGTFSATTVRLDTALVYYPTIAASRDGDTILTAWQVNTVGDYLIRYAYQLDTTNPGAVWNFASRDSLGANDYAPKLSVDGEGTTSDAIAGNYHLIWTVGTGFNYLNYTSRSTALDIDPWTAIETIDDLVSGPSVFLPVKGLTTQNRDGTWYPAAVWTDSRSGGSDDIYYVTPGMRSTVDAVPGTRVLDVDGVLFADPRTFDWPAGTLHDIFAPSPQAGAPGQQFAWNSWSDAGAQLHTVTATTTDATYTAQFSVQYEVVLDTSPTGLKAWVDGMEVSTPLAYWWDDGSLHDLDVTSPQPGPIPLQRYVWNSWSDAGPQSHQISVTMADTITANFGLEDEMTIEAWDQTNLVPLPDVPVYIDGPQVGITPHVAWLNNGQMYDIGVQDPYNDGVNDYNFVDWDFGLTANPAPVTGWGSIIANYDEAPPTAFSLEVAPLTRTINPGDMTTTFTITLKSLSGYAGDVLLSATALPDTLLLPAGPASAAFSPNPATVPLGGQVTSTLTIDNTATVPDDIYTITVVGVDTVSAAISDSNDTELIVVTPTFDVTATPLTLTRGPGQDAIYTVTVTSVNGYEGDVGLNATALPGGLLPPGPGIATFVPSVVSVPLAGSAQSTLTISNTGAVSDATYTITIIGDDPSGTDAFNVDLIVTTVPFFTMDATPATQQVSPGGVAAYTVTITSYNAYVGTVDVGVNHLIPAPNAMLTWSSTSVDVLADAFNTTTLTVDTNSSITDGDYTLTFWANDGGPDVNDDTILNVSTSPPGTISGSVKDENGDPIENADVELIDNNTQLVDSTTTDSLGFYEFTDVDPGSYTVKASKTGYRDDEKSVTLAGGEDKTQDLELKFGSIEGVVVDENGDPVPDATVQVLDENGDVVGTDTTNSQGRFEIDDLLLGTYTVRISADGFKTLTVDGVEITDTPTNELEDQTLTEEVTGNFLADYWWLLLIIIIIVVVLILVLMLAKRKKPAPEEAPPEYATAQVPAEQAPPYQEAPAEQPPYQEAPPEQYPPQEPQPETPPEETPPETPPEGYPPEE
ncbi:MAG: carboxypeptidase regulatory-like domain-containing protein [Thermoplasmata archaeon]|nr:carboxypeptidase regulatory-like domain-containing protein [Thermoplasmata archaeon]